MDRRERCRQWREKISNAKCSCDDCTNEISDVANTEREPDVCFIERLGTSESPLGACVAAGAHCLSATRVLLERGANPEKAARIRTNGRSIRNAFAVAILYDNEEAFIMMLDYASPVGFVAYGTWAFWVHRYHLWNRSKIAIACALRQMRRDDLVEPLLRTVAHISFKEWYDIEK